MVVVVVLGEHWAWGHLGGVELAAAKDARRRVHHGRAGGVEAVRVVVHGGGAVAGPLGGSISCGQVLPRGIGGVVLFCDCGRGAEAGRC